MLDHLYTGENERIGVIKQDGTIVEFENLAHDPTCNFRISGKDILVILEDDTVATWHTHPGASSNLSMNDQESFVAFPTIKHYIVGNDGTSCYQMVNDDHPHLARVS